MPARATETDVDIACKHHYMLSPCSTLLCPPTNPPSILHQSGIQRRTASKQRHSTLQPLLQLHSHPPQQHTLHIDIRLLSRVIILVHLILTA